MKPLVALAAALLLAGPLAAHEIVAGDIQIIHPFIPQPAASAMAAGGFMAIVNNGSEPDRLIGVESDIAKMTELHESRVDANGVGTMVHIDVLEIPAGGTVSLEHGGYHIMFMGLNRPLEEGQMIDGTLIFERAGRVEVEFQVDPKGPMDGHGGMDHSAMGHGTAGN